ncbi:MAG: hypothetical protein NNA20_00895 [Nitrospira sp.]|nr:hypothetical protein [Nitrospira sp.]MCP9441125.1 hypothetical protein [Nitrospira sp.]
MSLQPLSRVAINCLLAKGGSGLEGDGCLYDLSAPDRSVSPQTQLRAGDYVKLRLWLPDEDSHISVELAEVDWIDSHRLKVDLLSLSPEGRAKLNQFKSSQQVTLPTHKLSAEHILIRF